MRNVISRLLKLATILSLCGWATFFGINLFVAINCYDSNITVPIGLIGSAALSYLWLRGALRTTVSRAAALSSMVFSVFQCIAFLAETRAFKFIYLMNRKGLSHDEAHMIAVRYFGELFPALALAVGFFSAVVFFYEQDKADEIQAASYDALGRQPKGPPASSE